MTTVFIMKKFVTVWCFAILFNQALTNPIFYDIRENLDSSPPNEISEDDMIFFISQDGIYGMDSDILSSFGNENKYEDYDLSTLQTERFLEALELNAKINSGDIMSEYYNGKPQPVEGVEFANEYSDDDIPGTAPFNYDETKSYIKYLQNIEKDSKEKRQKAIYNNILDQDLEEQMGTSRYKRSIPAVNKMAKLFHDVRESKLRHNSIKISQSTPSNKMLKFISHINSSKRSKRNSLLQEVTNPKLRSKRSTAVDKMVKLIKDVNLQLRENSNKRTKRSLSAVEKVAKLVDDVNLELRESSNKRMKRSLSAVDKVAKLVNDVSLELRESSNKRMKRSLSAVDKVAKLVDDVSLQLRENSNKRMKRSLSSVDKVAKLVDDVNLQLKERSNKRTKRSISSVDKVAKLIDDVNLKFRDNSDKRFKRSLSSVDKVKTLFSEVGNQNLRQDLKKGVIMKNGADCGRGGGGGRRGGGDPDDAAGSGDGPTPDPDAEDADATNLRLTNIKKYNRRKQKKTDS